MQTIKALKFAILAAITSIISTIYGDPINFTTPLVFSGNTEITESSDAGWNTEQAFAVSVTGTGNLLTGNSAEAKPWRSVKLTGDGYLTMTRGGQWSIGFGTNGGSTKDFTGTLHIKHSTGEPVYFGFGQNDLSFANASLVLEASGSANVNTYFSNNQSTRDIGDLSTVGDNQSKVVVYDKNNATINVGYLNKSSTFGGNFAVEGASNVPSLNKVGTGTWTLTGNCDAVRLLTVSAGAVHLGSTGSFACPITVKSGAKLGGTGTVAGTLTVESGAILEFTATDALTFPSSSDLANFALDTTSLDASVTYTVAKGTASFPTLNAAQQQAGWVLFAAEGDICLKNSSTTISESTSLTEDTDWSETFVSIADGVTVNLNGHDLYLSGFSLGTDASIVNTGAKARLYVGLNGGDKTGFLDLDLGANIMPVFTGAAITIPQSYVPAGGIGFKDVSGTQLLYFQNCANGLAFLGHANLREAEMSWNKGAWLGAPVAIEGDGNVFTFDNGNWGTDMKAFNDTPFSGDGELAIKATDGVHSTLYLTSYNQNNTGFAGTLVLYEGPSYNSNNGVFLYESTDDGLSVDFNNASIVFASDLERTSPFTLHSNRGSSKATYTLGSLTTGGTHPENVVLHSECGSSGGVVVKLGTDGKGGGTFAGALSKAYGEDVRPFSVEKHGTETWTLTGSIDNGGTLSVYDGAVNLAGATVGTVTAIAVGAGGRLTGTSTIPAATAVSFADGSTLSGALSIGATPTTDGTVKLVPTFSGTTANAMTFTAAAGVSLAGFTLEADQVPVVPAGTEFTIATGVTTAPALGATATAAGWEVAVEDGNLVLTSTKQPPLVVDGTLTLEQDYDYSTGEVQFNAGATLDLNGHTMKIGTATVSGTLSIVNTGSASADLVATGEDKSWLWNANVTLAATVRTVLSGAAADIPQTFAPAGGIAFKDTDGEQLLYFENCANGLAVLGNASLKETTGDYSWKDKSAAFSFVVESTNNVFTTNGGRYSSDVSEFQLTPFTGSGNLELKGAGDNSWFVLLNKDTENTGSFTGRLVVESGVNFGGNSTIGHPNWAKTGTIALKNDADAAGNRTAYRLSTPNTWTKPTFEYGMLETEGEHPEYISVTMNVPVPAAEHYDRDAVNLVVGATDLSGTFAGTFDGATNCKFGIEKRGTGTWTLSGSVKNGADFTVSAGRVDFLGSLEGSTVTNLVVKNGAAIKLTGTVDCPITFENGAKLVLSSENEDFVTYTAGSLDLTGVTVEVEKGTFDGKRGHSYLKTTNGTLSGAGDANVSIPGLEYDTKKMGFSIVEGNLLRFVMRIGFICIVR